jgi:ribosome-associated heat shock protein Hsp15
MRSHAGEHVEAVRADRWLWAARFFRSRSLAAQACEGGKVDVGGMTAKPHKPIRVGDFIDLTLPGGKRRLRVLALSERRGPASTARQLYEDLTPPHPTQEQGPRERAGMRPTKRERRRMDRLRAWS